LAFYRDLSHYLSHHSKHPAANRDTLGWRPASFRHAAANRDTLRGKTGAGHLNLQARQLSTRSGQSGHAARKDCGGLMSACFCRHFWSAIFGRQFFAGRFWPAFSPAGPTRGPLIFLRAFPPSKEGRGVVGRPCSEAPPRENLSFLGLARRCAMGDIWGLFGDESSLLLRLKGRWKHPQRTGLASFHPPAPIGTLSRRLRSDEIAQWEGANISRAAVTLPLDTPPRTREGPRPSVQWELY
jgi:hypothetical protein